MQRTTPTSSDFRLTRRSLLGGALVTMAGLAHASARPAKFRFVHLTDLHIQPELGAAEGIKLAFRKVLSLRPRPAFVLLGGDLLMDLLAVDQGRAEVQVRLLQEALKPLEMPCYYSVGNHDVYGWTRRSASKDEPGYGKAMFAERIVRGPLYTAFDHGGWRFYMLDSIQPAANGWKAGIDDAQLEWLAGDLAGAPADQPKVMVTHVPVATAFAQFTQSATAAAPDSLIVANGKAVCDLARKHNVRLVLQGHTHVVEDIAYANTRYITSGAVSGNWWRGKRLGIFSEGFSVFDVDGSRLNWQYVEYGWKARTA